MCDFFFCLFKCLKLRSPIEAAGPADPSRHGSIAKHTEEEEDEGRVPAAA